MLSKLIPWLASTLSSACVLVVNNFIDFFQLVFDALVTLGITVVDALPSAGAVIPDVSSAPTGQSFDVFMSTLNWLFPVQTLVICTTLLCTTMLAFIVAAPVLRWLKIIT